MGDPNSLLVSEIFGPTLQGEGVSLGKACMFLRLGGCNLSCSWCDTPYTWAFDKRHAAMHESGIQYDPQTELRRMSVEEVAELLKKELQQNKINLLVISGGEPMLQQDAIFHLVHRLGFKYNVEIETAGTRALLPTYRHLYQGYNAQVRFNVSPKLSHSGNDLDKRFVLPALASYANLQNSTFKFVVDPGSYRQDFGEIHQIVAHGGLQIHPSRVYIMPLGTHADEVSSGMKELVEPTLSCGYNLTPRLHTLIWGNERGK